MADRYLEAIADADPYPYWLDDVDEPDSKPTLVKTESCDLCIVGGGYTGLWAAIIAKERDPDRDIVLIDAFTVGSAASGRNGGFMESSLTHGIANGQSRFPEDLAALEQLGLENLDQIEAGHPVATGSIATMSGPGSSTSPPTRPASTTFGRTTSSSPRLARRCPPRP